MGILVIFSNSVANLVGYFDFATRIVTWLVACKRFTGGATCRFRFCAARAIVSLSLCVLRGPRGAAFAAICAAWHMRILCRPTLTAAEPFSGMAVRRHGSGQRPGPPLPSIAREHLQLISARVSTKGPIGEHTHCTFLTRRTIEWVWEANSNLPK